MGKRIGDKVAIIIGASRGIGEGIARVFAKEGAKLLLVGRDENKLSKLTQELCSEGDRVCYYQGDIAKENDMAGMVEKAINTFGRIDILCQNAGIYPQVDLEDMTIQEWDEVLETNLRGTFLAIKACLPQMKTQQYGKIVLTSSISGPKVGWPGGTHYTASKAGMNGLMRTAAVELAKYNITINGVEPGNIVTGSLEDLGEDWLENMKKAIPLGYLGVPEDVAYAHLFLASDESRYITGQSIVVDGGQILPESHFMDY